MNEKYKDSEWEKKGGGNFRMCTVQNWISQKKRGEKSVRLIYGGTRGKDEDNFEKNIRNEGKKKRKKLENFKK